MKGEIAMLYTGNTLREALGKALGTRDQYGRKIEKFGTEKQDGGENPHASPEAIARARENAVQDARTWISSVDVSEGARERARVYIYDRQTGSVRILTDDQAGATENSSFSSTDRHFRFRFSWHPNREIILATAHSHPHANRSGGLQASREADRIDRLNENIDRNRDDQNLRRIAPLVLKTPSGEVRVFQETGGYD